MDDHYRLRYFDGDSFVTTGVMRSPLEALKRMLTRWGRSAQIFVIDQNGKVVFENGDRNITWEKHGF